MYTHHAYLFYTDSLATSELPEEYRAPSLDVVHMQVDRLSIDDARLLSTQSLQKPLQAPLRIFVISARDVALEAQNALLKLFEEPPAHAVFYLLLPKTAYLLPTLTSRLQVFTPSREHKNEERAAFNTFQMASYGERLSSIAEKTKLKDVVWVEEILAGIEAYVAEDPLAQETLLRDIIFVRGHVHAKGASLKMLLEEVALALPRT